MLNILGAKLRLLRKDHRVALRRLSEPTASGGLRYWDVRRNNQSHHAGKWQSPIQRDYMFPAHLLDSRRAVNEEADDALFYHRYRKMNAATKAKIRQMALLLGEPE